MRWWLVIPRKTMHLRQVDVARRVGISSITYGNYETGRLTPRPSTAKKIAAVLGVDWTRFYEDDEEGK